MGDKIFYQKDQPKDPLEWINGLNASGYAGITRKGCICDRREFPDAIPIKRNYLFNVAEPKEFPKQ